MLNCHNGIFFFFKQGGQEGGDRNKPFKSSLRELHKDLSMEQIRVDLYCYYSSAAVVLSVDPCTPGVSPRPFLGFQEIKNFLHNNTKILFAFLLC